VVNQRPQYLGVHLTLVQSGSKQESLKCKEAYVGWTGMASASSLSQFNATKIGDGGLETIEIDPQFAQGIGLAQWDIVCEVFSSYFWPFHDLYRLILGFYMTSLMQIWLWPSLLRLMIGR